MRRQWLGFGLMIGLTLAQVTTSLAGDLPLRPVDNTTLWTPDISLANAGDRAQLIRAINQSLNYLNSSKAIKAYKDYAIPEFTRPRVQRSLQRFKQLLQTISDPNRLQQKIQQEFTFYQVIGNDAQGTVAFTAYFEPTYPASRTRTAEFIYPLYRKPKTLANPNPSRIAIEGIDGLLGSKSPLAGSELVWFRDRLQAYLVQVQGSAKLQLTNGSIMTINFDGNTNYDYTSIGKELVKDGIFSLTELSLPKLIDYFTSHPEKLSEYIPRNNRYVFFRETKGTSPIGSLGLPVTPYRSIATDKTLMPPGAIAVLSTTLPHRNREGNWEKVPVHHYVLDQDTGGAIKGPGRVDIFLGNGVDIQTQAGLVNDPGRLYYLLLKK